MSNFDMLKKKKISRIKVNHNSVLWTLKGNATCNGISWISALSCVPILNYASAPTQWFIFLIPSFFHVDPHIYFYRAMSIFSEYI